MARTFAERDTFRRERRTGRRQTTGERAQHLGTHVARRRVGRRFMRRLAGLQMNEPEEGDFPAVTDASEEAWRRTLNRFDEGHRRLIEAVATLTDERLSEIVPGKDYTVEYMLRGLLRHHVYHAGQIALLKKG